MRRDLRTMQAALAQALEDVHGRIADAVLGLDEEALRWRPVQGMLSVEELVVLAAAEERLWIGAVVVGMQGAEPGPPSQPGAAAHPLFELGGIGQFSQMVLQSLDPEEWLARRVVAGQNTSVAGCVLHVLENLSRILGQVQVISELWRARVSESGSRS